MELPKALRLINGWLEVVTGGYQIKTAKGTVTGANTDLVAGVTGKKLRVLGYRLQARATNTGVVAVSFADTGGVISQPWDLNPREGVVVNSGPVGFDCETVAGSPLTVTLSDGSQHANVTAIYIEV